MLLPQTFLIILAFIYILLASFKLYKKEWLKPSRIPIRPLEKMLYRNPEIAGKFEEIETRYAVFQSVLTAVGLTTILFILIV